jgi:hypothetical protein
MVRERELTTAERMVYGECPVCHAPDGEPCFAEVGLQLGRKANGMPMQTGEGAHLGRLQAAPKRIREVPVQ